MCILIGKAPAMFDSTGVLSMLDRFRRPGQARWVPILDTNSLRKEGRAERYWPVGVTGTHMSCAILKVSLSLGETACMQGAELIFRDRTESLGSRDPCYRRSS